MPDRPGTSGGSRRPAAYRVPGGLRTGAAAGPLVHGMGRDPVPATWPPLVDDEVTEVLGRYRDRSGRPRPGPARVTWRSPRPMSAAALVEVDGGQLFVKRHHRAVRSPRQLASEHAFARHLRRAGQPVPQVLSTVDGRSTVGRGCYVYEVQRVVDGVDVYRDVPSWHPFIDPAHARAAGRALATFHRAAADFPLPARPPAVLLGSVAVVTSPDPRRALADVVARRPGLARALGHRALARDFERTHAAAVEALSPVLRRLPGQWGHGDWHPSNLTWSGSGADATVVGVVDLGLANRTSAAHDLAVAVERSCVDWLDVGGRGTVEPDLPALQALVEGYVEARPLTAVERAALVGLLPVVHLEYALSEVEYFGDVVGDAADTELAYTDYFVGHTRWFATDAGAALCNRLRDVLWRSAGTG